MRLHYSKQHKPDQLFDELLAAGAVTPNDKLESMPDGKECWITVEDGADKTKIDLVVAAHVPGTPPAVVNFTVLEANIDAATDLNALKAAVKEYLRAMRKGK